MPKTAVVTQCNGTSVIGVRFEAGVAFERHSERCLQGGLYFQRRIFLEVKQRVSSRQLVATTAGRVDQMIASTNRHIESKFPVSGEISLVPQFARQWKAPETDEVLLN
jgi:hypothetical protein